jgi:hypothetical protein
MMRSNSTCLSTLICAVTIATTVLSANGSLLNAADLAVMPESIALADGFTRQQILVDSDTGDVTRQATFRSLRPEVALVDALGHVTPVADGEAEIAVQFNGQQKLIPVLVTGVAAGRPVDFATDVAPILSRYGCNSGGCHGKAGGQNGFQLSLFGFDKVFDHEAIAKLGRGRRIFAAAPEQSMLLTKATGHTPHGGGARFDSDSEAYRLIHRWIELGAPASSPDAPRVVRLHVTPNERILGQDGQQQLAITAEYSDGARRDVTRQSDYSSNLDPVAMVDRDGLVQAVGQSGEAAVMARYQGQVAVFHAIVPHGESVASIPDFTPHNYIDELAAEKWKKLGLLPSPMCDDATFLRRVTVDLCGRLPTVDEAKAFLADTSSNKRQEAIDRLLDSPDYPAYFAMRWGAILRNSRLAGADQAAHARLPANGRTLRPSTGTGKPAMTSCIR